MGGIKAIMKGSAVVLSIFILFEGPNSVFMAAVDVIDATVGTALPQQYLSFAELPGLTHRPKRSVNKLHLSEKDLHNATGFAKNLVSRLARHEQNLIWGHIVPQKGSPSHVAMLVSWADDAALDLAKEGYISSKAAVYIANKYCSRYGIPYDSCAEQMAKSVKACDQSFDCPFSQYRTINGFCNNQQEPKMGATYSAYARLLPPSYDDSFWEPRGSIKRLPSPSDISSVLVSVADRLDDEYTTSLAAWTNLVSNDLSHTVSNRMLNTGENIMCCSEFGYNLAPRHRHPLCMPLHNGHSKCINYVRSMVAKPATCLLGPAQQMNAVTHFLDGSNIYGSTIEMASSLRAFKNGKLKLDDDASIPRVVKTNCHHNSSCFLSGDMRINMDMLSAVLHTILIREHNRVASLLHTLNPHWDDEKLYQEARRIVIAEIQHITYREWLPIIIGKTEIAKQPSLQIQLDGYGEAYNKHQDPTVLNSFANAAMKFVYSLVDGNLMLYDESRSNKKNLLIRETITSPELLENTEVFDSILRGLATQRSQANDLTYSDAVAKYLYSIENKRGVDALSLNIQRGRDHGLPPYTDFRKLFGLSYESFDKISDSIPREVVYKLMKIYKKVSDVDLIVGGLAEKRKHDSLVGTLFAHIISKQMSATRSGDKFFYDNPHQPAPFSLGQLNEIRKTSLARLFCDNSHNVRVMQPSVFRKPQAQRNILVSCSDVASIPEMNLKAWKS